jgi:succinate dehydrogenase/fumarate reductase-like Fe-S protein
MNKSNDNVIRLQVQRGCGDGPSRIDDYEIPAEIAASSLLDCLRWVRGNLDNTLAFRYSCINANACKECMMQLDGKVVYACLAKLQPGAAHKVEPLQNKVRLRDLVSEIAPSKERLFDEEASDDADA